MAEDLCKGVGVNPGSLRWCSGRTNVPGIRTKVLYIAKSDIVKFPVLPAAITKAVKEIVTYKGDFTLAEGAKFNVIEVLSKKSTVESSQHGEKPSKCYMNKGTFLYPGTEEESTAFAKAAANGDYVFIFQMPDGKYRVLGNEMFDSDVKISQKLGNAGSSDSGTTIEVEILDVCPAPFYTGKLTTVDGDIPATPDV